ncbi:MAG: ABC transporter substrate-binding protein [Bacteriovorax sp.]|nr:ABC transporter substrate-binding protein [Bacteriovorax sp.]
MSLKKIKNACMNLLIIFVIIFYCGRTTYAQEVKPVKKIIIGIVYYGKNDAVLYTDGSKRYEDFFTKNGLPVEIVLINALDKSSVEASRNIDFKFDRATHVSVENLANQNYIPIVKNAVCFRQPHLFVSSTSKIKTLEDLKGKKIILADLDTPRYPTLNLLVTSGLNKSKIYYTNKIEFAFTTVKKGFAEAVLYDEYFLIKTPGGNGKPEYNIPVAQSEILSEYKEIEISPPSTCTVVTYSKKVDKEIVEKFNKVSVAYRKQDPSMKNFLFVTIPTSLEEFTKETASYPWAELNILRGKIGQIKETTTPSKN